MKNAKDIIDMIKNAGAEDAQAIRDTLEDGAVLLALGITDEDQEAVEDAHDLIAYEEWLEAQKMTDDAEARRLYEEKDSFVGTFTPHPYHVWRERYGYSDTATARADYAEYQKQLDILTPEKRKPGRPATGNAMTPAEKQRAYRERQKKRETEMEGIEARVLVLEQQLAEALAEIERLKGNV